MLGSNHATDWRPVNGVVSTGDPGNAESIVAITISIHAMETGINHPPYKSSRLDRELYFFYIIELQLERALNFVGTFAVEFFVYIQM